MNRPFLKWAGNKYRLLSKLLPLIGSPKRYCEPFAGSLSVSLNVEAEEYIINDINQDLINLYSFVINDSNFINDCEDFFKEANEESTFYNRRSCFNDITELRQKSLLFVYLNRHCFNGLTRYNKSGKFNVPFGKYKSPYFPRNEMENFKEFFKNKEVARFNSLSFDNEELYKFLDKNDVVYFDPPYIPVSETSNFTNYSSEGFSFEQQIELAQLAKKLTTNGVKVIISNHDCPQSRELYSSAKIIPIEITHLISAKSSSRKKITEIIAVFE